MSALIALEVLDDHRQARFPRPVATPEVPGRDAHPGLYERAEPRVVCVRISHAEIMTDNAPRVDVLRPNL